MACVIREGVESVSRGSVVRVCCVVLLCCVVLCCVVLCCVIVLEGVLRGCVVVWLCYCVTLYSHGHLFTNPFRIAVGG